MSDRIPIYREINECHAATGFPLRSDLDDFHVFTFAETYPCERQAMPPYRRGFHQVVYLETMGEATMQFENEELAGAGRVLIFSPPEQVLSWICGGTETGYMLYFKEEFLPALGRPLEDAFSFFDPFSVSVVPVEEETASSLLCQFDRLRTVYHAAHPYRRPKLGAMTTELLYDCLALHEARNEGTESAGLPRLVSAFRQMLVSCFQQHCSVENYARCLNVSADHLGAMVKKHTGRTVGEWIDERVMLEAKRLLAHTDLSVGEVAHYLQFSEPTHFTRFFKRHAGKTPLAFRRPAAMAAGGPG